MISIQNKTKIYELLNLSYKGLRTSLLNGDKYAPPSFDDDNDE